MPPQVPMIISRFQNAWNAFLNRDPTSKEENPFGPSYSSRPDRPRLRPGNEKSIVGSIYNRLGIDGAGVDIHHVRQDQNGSYIETIQSGLNDCLNISANKDQTGRAFVQDVIMSMLDEGSVAVVPVDTKSSPLYYGSYDIQSLRTGKIVQWFPDAVRLSVYNDRRGIYEDITLPKSVVAIIENPFYSVMNQPNSTLRRLTRKLNLLDAIDEQSGSGKLDLIVQLPYAIKTTERQKQADNRRDAIVDQLRGSKYGIAYIDATEKVTQLNRPIENNLMAQIEFLTKMLYSQLGITETVLDGTADEKTMLNYYNRSVKPIVSAVTESLRRTFLTKTARTQGHTIQYSIDPFSLVPVKDLAELADKLTRNEILSSNEFRAIIGYKPSDAPGANDLRNKNLTGPAGGASIPPVTPPMDRPVSEITNN